MRVLHVGKYFPPARGGIESFMRDLMVAQARRGDEVCGIVHHHLAGRPTEWDPGADVGVPRVLRVRIHGRLLYTPICPTFGWHLDRLIHRLRPQVLHVHVPNVSAFWLLGSRVAARVPWVVQWQADAAGSPLAQRIHLAYRLYRPWERRLLARCAAVIASSPPYLDGSRALQAWRSRCRVIPLGVDSQRLGEPGPELTRWAEDTWVDSERIPADTSRQVGDAPFRVLWVGRMAYYKGLGVLLDAVRAVGASVTLCLAGDGEQMANVRESIARLGVGDAVRVIGDVSDDRVRALMASADCLCLPSLDRSESWGMVSLEAMRFGCPVVASEIPGSGPGWVVRKSGAGVTVRPGDAADLAQALRRLRDAPDLRRRYGAAGREAVATQFHIDTAAGEINRLYEEIR